MKHLLLIISFCIIGKVQSADLFVNSSGAPGTFSTITSAIASAVDNDRIIISPANPYFEDIVIDRSLTFISSTEATSFQILGNITFVGSPNRNCTIIGAVFQALIANTGTSTAYNCNLTVVDSEYNSFNIGAYVYFKSLFNTISGSGAFYDGKIIANEIITLTANSSAGGIQDTIEIIANKIKTSLTLGCNDRYTLVANNYINSDSSNASGLRITQNLYSATTENFFLNNTIIGYGSSTSNAPVYCTASGNLSNQVFINNIFISEVGLYALYNPTSGTNWPKLYYNSFSNLSNTYVDGQLLAGNTIGEGALTDFDSFGRSSFVDHVDSGLPGISYYDIDISQNDRGTYGGPYSIDNYWNTVGSGRARIYELDIPSEIFNGVSPQITAEGTHMK